MSGLSWGEEAIETLQGIVVLGGDWGALAGVMCDRCSRITTVAEERFSRLVNATPKDFGGGPLDACSSAAAVAQCSGQVTTMSSAWILNSWRWVAIAVQL